MYDIEEFNNYFALWNLENHSPDWHLFKSPEATTLVRNRAASFGGLVSISHFTRAFNELRTSGAIKQLRQPKPANTEESDELTAETYRTLPSEIVKQRFSNDPEFRSQVETLIAQGKI